MYRLYELSVLATLQLALGVAASSSGYIHPLQGQSSGRHMAGRTLRLRRSTNTARLLCAAACGACQHVWGWLAAALTQLSECISSVPQQPASEHLHLESQSPHV